MKPHHSNRLQKLILLSLCLIISLACASLTGSKESELTAKNLMKTQVIMELTQTAMAQPVEPTATAEPTEIPAIPTPAPTATPAVQSDYCFEYVCFSHGDALASDFVGTVVPENDFGAPGYIQIDFTGYPTQNEIFKPFLQVYLAEEFVGGNEAVQEDMDELIAFLDDQPEEVDKFPTFPFKMVAQFIQSKIAYFAFENGSGVRFATQYGQGLWPVTNESLIYHFQGLTDDGKYLVIGVFPITNPQLIDDGKAFMDKQDYATFDSNFDSYLPSIQKMLNEQPDNSFTPDLAALDKIMKSIYIKAE